MQPKTRRILMIISGFVLAVLAVLVFLNIFWWKGTGFSPQAIHQNEQGQTQSSEVMVASSLTGLPISQNRAEKPVLAVMVENAPLARPQSGLSKADIVYETLAEGGITRYMALFQSQEAEVVGPVRSARTYFVEIVREYDAWYSHVGGNADGLNLIANYDLHDLDQFVYDKPYWRDKARMNSLGLEHSMYTNTNDLRALIDDGKKPSFGSWIFRDEAPVTKTPKPQKVTVDFSFEIFQVVWEYDPAENVYKRSVGGISDTDAENDEPFKAKNVLVQYVTMTLVPAPAKGDEGALKMVLIGEGDGILFQDGQAIDVQWKKEKSGDRTRFYHAKTGEEVSFNRGVTWVEIVEKGKVSFE